MKTKETSIYSGCKTPNDEITRQKAIDWWNNLKSNGLKAGYAEKHIQQGFRYNSLTGKEIEEIWRKECNHIENEVFKPNQKQFKQFDESLFQTYIDKFNKDDKFKALKILWEDLNVTKELNEALK